MPCLIVSVWVQKLHPCRGEYSEHIALENQVRAWDPQNKTAW